MRTVQEIVEKSGFRMEKEVVSCSIGDLSSLIEQYEYLLNWYLSCIEHNIISDMTIMKNVFTYVK